MPSLHNDHTGARIAHLRKVRRLTQRELADLSHVSYSTLTKVEQGVLPASPSVLGALARALSVPATELTGQPYLEELRQDQLDGLINPIREALNIYDLGPDPDVSPRTVEELAEHADRLCAMVRATNIKQVAAELPGLIHEATTTAHLNPVDRSWRLLASTYRTAYDVTAKLGFFDLGMVALRSHRHAGGAAGVAGRPGQLLGRVTHEAPPVRCPPWRTGGPRRRRPGRENLLVTDSPEGPQASPAASSR
ncbi:helix-turn-helix domain-containing protein [Streptomyces sp. NPDC056411]|uniref:helix-turn-helix domain-containing protein n=1 Tax=Streptomyces sp. NPDC056411 TaxID=3345813 RepID=UPI0035DA75CA